MLFSLVTLITTRIKDTYMCNDKVQLETLKKCAYFLKYTTTNIYNKRI